MQMINDPDRHEHREHYWNPELARTEPFGRYQDAIVHTHDGGNIPHTHTGSAEPSGTVPEPEHESRKARWTAARGRVPERKPTPEFIGKQGGLKWMDKLGSEIKRNLSGDDKF